MNWLTVFLLLATAYLVVFLQAAFHGVRHLLGAQPDLLPGLMVYAGLHCGLPSLCLLAVCGGVWFDSLSANPLGVSVLPLLLAGLLVHRSRALVLREQWFAQMILGLGASAAVPAATVLLLLNADRQPLLGWFSLWQWLVVTLLGGLMTPLWCRLFDRVRGLFSYQSDGPGSFRPDREIKRGRF
jgi:cell shape-determining protein MreD